MISTRQEDNLSGKTVLERRSAIFVVKTKIYHENYGRSSEQPFRSAIEYANSIIIFCAVGYHHKNSIFERKFQTLLLGARTLPPYKNYTCQRQ